MKKYIFEEVPAEHTDFSYYFCDEFFEEQELENYNHNIFIIYNDLRKYCGKNNKEFNNIIEKLDEMLNYYYDVKNKEYYYYNSVKEIMENYGIKYSPKKCNLLKKLLEEYDRTTTSDAEVVAEFLTITTGKEWENIEISGYCQGDYCNVIFCKEYNNEKNMEIAGEIYLGCAKEYRLIINDENEEEQDTVYGYFVADCEYKEEHELKEILCKQEGISPQEAELKIISNSYTVIKNEYKIVA